MGLGELVIGPGNGTFSLRRSSTLEKTKSALPQFSFSIAVRISKLWNQLEALFTGEACRLDDYEIVFVMVYTHLVTSIRLFHGCY